MVWTARHTLPVVSATEGSITFSVRNAPLRRLTVYQNGLSSCFWLLITKSLFTGRPCGHYQWVDLDSDTACVVSVPLGMLLSSRLACICAVIWSHAWPTCMVDGCNCRQVSDSLPLSGCACLVLCLPAFVYGCLSVCLLVCFLAWKNRFSQWDCLATKTEVLGATHMESNVSTTGTYLCCVPDWSVRGIIIFLPLYGMCLGPTREGQGLPSDTWCWLELPLYVCLCLKLCLFASLSICLSVPPPPPPPIPPPPPLSLSLSLSVSIRLSVCPSASLPLSPPSLSHPSLPLFHDTLTLNRNQT